MRFAEKSPHRTGHLPFLPAAVVRAWAPYVLLAIMVGLWGLESVKALLAPIGTKFNWPFLHNLVIKTAPIVAKNTPYPAVYMVNIGTAAGTAIFIAGLLSVLIIPNYGFGRAFACFGRTIKTLRGPILTIALILGLGWIMNYSGMSSTLALAFTATGAPVPVLLSHSWVGWECSSPAPTPPPTPCSGRYKRPRHPNRGEPHPHGGGQLQRRRDRQDDFAAKHRGGHRGHRPGGGGRLHLPLALLHSVGMVLIISLITLLQAYVLQWMVP